MKCSTHSAALSHSTFTPPCLAPYQGKHCLRGWLHTPGDDAARGVHVKRSICTLLEAGKPTSSGAGAAILHQARLRSRPPVVWSGQR
jgi:hypothetical protein